MALDTPQRPRAETVHIPSHATLAGSEPQQHHTPLWRRPIPALVALTALAAVVRFAGIGQQSYWFDESVTVWQLHHSFTTMLAEMPAYEGTPPLYFVLAWFWGHLFGLGAAGLRSLSAVSGTLTIPVVWATGRRLVSERVGLAAAALAACNPLLIWYSQEARAYALLVLLSSVALLAWVHLCQRPSARWATCWALTSALAFATHYYSALLIVPEAVWLMHRHWRTRCVRWAIVGVLAFSVCLLPLLRTQLRGLGGTDTWMSGIPLLWRLSLVPRSFAIGPDAGVARLLMLATGLAVAAALVLLCRRLAADTRRRVAPAAGLLLAGLAMLGLMLAVGYDQLDYRNLLALWLPAALVVAAGLAGTGAGTGIGRLGMSALAALCAVGLTAAATVLLDARYQRPDWSAVAHAVGTHDTPPLFMVRGCQTLPLSLYLPGLGGAPGNGVRTETLDLVSAVGQYSTEAVDISDWYETCTPVAHNFQAPQRLGAFTLSGPPVRIGGLRVWRMRASHPVRITNESLDSDGLVGELLTRTLGHGDR